MTHRYVLLISLTYQIFLISAALLHDLDHNIWATLHETLPALHWGSWIWRLFSQQDILGSTYLKAIPFVGES